MKHRISILAGLALLAACGDLPTEPTPAPMDVAAPSYALIGGSAWTASGLGTVNLLNDGSGGDPAMDYFLSPSGVSTLRTWSFKATSSQTGPLTVDYDYSGMHSWCKASVFLRAVVIRAGVTVSSEQLAYARDNNCNYSYPSGGFDESGSYTFNVQAGDVFGFEFGGDHYDGSQLMFGTFTVSQPVVIYTSGTGVTTWNPIFPSSAYADWGNTVCTNQPLVGPNANWVNPHPAFVPTTNDVEWWKNPYIHPWADDYFDAPWMNSWNDLGSDGPGGHSWTKYETTVSGNGSFVVQLLADNCSWIYLDGGLIGVQGTDLSKNTYPVDLNGSHTLSFIIFDGGGAAGGKFRLETYGSYVGGGGDPGDIQPPPVADNTPPVIVANVTGTLGDNGWYTGDVSVSWTVTDAESNVTSTTGCDAQSVTSDTDGVTFTCEATSAGGTDSESVTVKRDATAPTIAADLNGTVVNGWYNTDVDVVWTVSDILSGIATTDCADNTVATDGDPISQTCSATDEAGNTGTGTTGDFKRDATDPVIEFVGNAGSYTVDQGVTITCSATDALSGVDSEHCPGASDDAYTFGVGTTTLNATAMDLAGNSFALSTSFTVSVDSGSLCALVRRWVTNKGVANSMCQQLANGAYRAFVNHVKSQSGKKFLAADKAAILIDLAGRL